MKIKMLVLFTFIMLSCNTKKNPKNTQSKEYVSSAHSNFGMPVSEANYLSYKEAIAAYSTLKIGDTIPLKFISSITNVCAKKGCWMNLSQSSLEERVMVRFKDYGFFVPIDSKGSEVIVEGKAFVDVVSVSELKHYASDAGKSSQEIDQINVPKTEFSFEASGVLIKNNLGAIFQ